MRALDLFLLTSHWEGLPQVLLQARASSLPAVATRVGGAAEAIVDGQHGWLCEPGGIDELAARVIHLLTDSAERERMRCCGGYIPDEFESRFALEKRVKLYDTLLATAGLAASTDTGSTRNEQPVAR